MKYPYSYLVSIQFLGFRFHGWQKQRDQQTLHKAVDKTLSFVFNHNNFKSIGAGRTDAKVSAQEYVFQFFCKEAIVEEIFVSSFNQNAPADLKVTKVEPVNNQSFNIIQSAKQKEYHYYFSNQGKNHPYAAPFIAGFENLDVGLMKKGATLFQGTHFFGSYCTKPSNDTQLMRTINTAKIVENTFISASFFPDVSYAFVVKGSGFLRYQIRLMMGALLELGHGKLSLSDIKNSLKEGDGTQIMSTIAPGSGLHLYQVAFSP